MELFDFARSEEAIIHLKEWIKRKLFQLGNGSPTWTGCLAGVPSIWLYILGTCSDFLSCLSRFCHSWKRPDRWPALPAKRQKQNSILEFLKWEADRADERIRGKWRQRIFLENIKRFVEKVLLLYKEACEHAGTTSGWDVPYPHHWSHLHFWIHDTPSGHSDVAQNVTACSDTL